jgi:KUP system potassium uptake protein
MIASVATIITFGSSDRLASAYGTAVATTMLLTTVLLYRAMTEVWHWPRAVAILTGGIFFIVDVSFFCANLLKIAEGGWLPLSLAALIFVIMITWRRGVDAMHSELVQTPEEAQRFLARLKSGAIPRIEGTTVFITRSNQKVSRLIVDHARYTGVLPRRTVALSIRFESTPRIPEPKCAVIEELGEGIWRIVARFGFFEIPDLRAALSRARGLEPPIDFSKARFEAARDVVVRKPRGSAMAGWRIGLFAFLYRNAAKIVDRFNLPPDRVIEIARQIEI